MVTTIDVHKLMPQLLNWYDSHGRELPWRIKPKGALLSAYAACQLNKNPYFVSLSEIMLQQTTVKSVIPYYKNFIKKWPDIHSLSSASLDDVLASWSGLGYYARGRNLHKCSQIISKELNGVFPSAEDELKKLPGIGPYTAAAISAIAFGLPTIAVDGNVERVMARIHAISEPLPKSRKKIFTLASKFILHDRPGDFLQALMDLGATVCTPRKPSCNICPWAESCKAFLEDTPTNFPVKVPKLPIQQRYGYAFWTVKKDGAILLNRRAEKGLLGGMLEVPSIYEIPKNSIERTIKNFAPCSGKWVELPGCVNHTFSHFRINMTIYTGKVDGRSIRQTNSWYRRDQFSNLALPSLTKKIVKHVESFGQGTKVPIKT